MMKLTKEQVDKLASLILGRLKDKGLVVFKANEAVVMEGITEALLKDLRAEDALDKEVEQILKSHSSEIDSGKLDYRKMFNMIKMKLARERGIVL